jgi:hypothetical protein
MHEPKEPLEEGKAQHVPPQMGFDPHEPQMAMVAVSGIAILILLVLVILAVQFYFDRVAERQTFTRVTATIAQDVRDLRSREDAQLYRYEFVDRAKGQVRIPVERAMELMVREASQGRAPYATRSYTVASTQAVAPPAPAAAPAQPAGTAPAQQGVNDAPQGVQPKQ